MVILAIGAHPDDIEFGCYGTLAKLSQNDEIHFLIFSAGELGGSKPIRIQEAIQSADLIKANIKILEYPDGAIPVCVKIIDEIRSYISEIKPQVIFTIYPGDTHQDHRNVTNIILSSCESVDRILFYEVPSSDANFHPNVYFDITEYFHLKTKALNYHISQKAKPYLDIDEIQGLARYRSYLCHRHGRLFEAFYLYKEIEN